MCRFTTIVEIAMLEVSIDAILHSSTEINRLKTEINTVMNVVMGSLPTPLQAYNLHKKDAFLFECPGGFWHLTMSMMTKSWRISFVDDKHNTILLSPDTPSAMHVQRIHKALPSLVSRVLKTFPESREFFAAFIVE